MRARKTWGQPNETVRPDVWLENETVWLTQAQLCELFGVVKSNISYHLKNIYGTNELDYGATVQKIRTVRLESGRNVARDIEYFTFDVATAVLAALICKFCGVSCNEMAYDGSGAI